MLRRRRTPPRIKSPEPNRTIDAGSGTTGSDAPLAGAEGVTMTGGEIVVLGRVGATGGGITGAGEACVKLRTEEAAEEFTFRLATGVVNSTVPDESEIAAEDAVSAVATAGPVVKLERAPDSEQVAGLQDPKATARVPASPAEMARVVEPELVKLMGVWA